MLQIVAKISKLGSISKDRKQTIELTNVAVMSGDFCEGEERRIVFLNAKESEQFNKFSVAQGKYIN